MTETFDPDWLDLREPFDHAARSLDLAEQLVARLPARPKLLDLGAGTGSLFRWLAPLIGRAQAWTLLDADPAMLDDAFDAIADWADLNDWAVTTPGRAMLVHTPQGAWRVEGVVADLAGVSTLPLKGHDAVVNTALCDLVSARWIETLVPRLTCPFYAALMVDGRAAWAPAHPLDRAVANAFKRDQGRDKGFGPALGPRAPAHMAATFKAASVKGGGWQVETATSDWRIGQAALGMLRAVVEGDANAARAADPRRAESFADWRDDRLRAASRGKLRLMLGHRDLLALPR
jgi:SAM-dependent methyltransferase